MTLKMVHAHVLQGFQGSEVDSRAADHIRVSVIRDSK